MTTCKLRKWCRRPCREKHYTCQHDFAIIFGCQYIYSWFFCHWENPRRNLMHWKQMTIMITREAIMIFLHPFIAPFSMPSDRTLNASTNKAFSIFIFNHFFSLYKTKVMSLQWNIRKNMNQLASLYSIGTGSPDQNDESNELLTSAMPLWKMPLN